MSQDSEDSFDDDDVDFDQLFTAAKSQQTKQSLTTRSVSPSGTFPPRHNIETNAAPQRTSVIASHNEPTGTTTQIQADPVALKGENAILRAKLQMVNQKYEDEYKKMREHYNLLLKTRNEKIVALSDSITKYKDDNEFLTSENKTLSAKYIKPNKKRKVQDESFELRTNANSTLPASNHNQLPQSDQTTDTSTKNTTNSSVTIKSDSSKDAQVAIVNQVSIFQDEKSSFIEGIFAHVIPGMNRSTLEYLSNISSNFDFGYKDFRILKTRDSIKTSITNYLIGFENKNRIDLLLSSFIDVLFQYILQLFELGTSLLPVPFLLSLIHFSLNYKSKAISLQLLEESTINTISILDNFKYILKQDIPYLDDNNNTDNQFESTKDLKLDAVEKTRHIKILEVFVTIYSMDILETLSKLSCYFEPFDEKYIMEYWRLFPKDLIIQGLSIKTPIGFVFNIIEILISSINEDKFAFNNTNKTKPKALTNELNDLLDNLISLLGNGLEQDLNVYGLNRTLGSNYYSTLLDILVPSSANTDINNPNNNLITAIPETHSSDKYSQILNKTNTLSYKNRHCKHVLMTHLQILKFFELYFSIKPTSSTTGIKVEILIHLISTIINVLGKQQEILLRSPRSVHSSLRLELISIIVRLIHYLVSPDGEVSIRLIPKYTLRELLVSLLRISSESVKPLSIELLTSLRLSGFKHSIFDNKYVESSSYELYSLTDELNSLTVSNDIRNEQIQIDIQSANGLEVNYNDETIDLARDVLGQCITGDEADMLHYSINYDYGVNDDELEMM